MSDFIIGFAICFVFVMIIGSAIDYGKNNK